MLGIAKTLLSRRARITGDPSSSAATYHHLREITRCRRTLVRHQTAASHRIHALADNSSIAAECGAAQRYVKLQWAA